MTLSSICLMCWRARNGSSISTMKTVILTMPIELWEFLWYPDGFGTQSDLGANFIVNV